MLWEFVFLDSLHIEQGTNSSSRKRNVNIQRIIEQFTNFFLPLKRPKLLNCLYIAQDVAIKEVLMWMFTKMFTQL